VSACAAFELALRWESGVCTSKIVKQVKHVTRLGPHRFKCYGCRFVVRGHPHLRVAEKKFDREASGSIVPVVQRSEARVLDRVVKVVHGEVLYLGDGSLDDEVASDLCLIQWVYGLADLCGPGM